MSSVRRFLLVVVTVGVAVVAIGLGRWQLRRLRDRRASNVVLIAARQRPPIELTGPISADVRVDSGRRVLARGRFATRDQILLRGRVQNDGPGLQVVTPFEFDGGAVLWVVRGFVPSPDAVTPPQAIPLPDTGIVTITGLALAIPITQDSGAPLAHDSVTTWRRLDRGTLTRLRSGSMPVYLLLAADSTGPGHLAAIPVPELGDGPHLGYALQWFGIALAVLTFGVIVLWRDGRAPSRHREVP